MPPAPTLPPVCGAWGPFRADNYGLVPTADYLAAADRQIFKILQIEHIDAVKQIEEILDVPGIDAIIVGQFDLSGSLGILGQVYAPENLEQIRTVFRACRRRGIHCGISSEPKRRSCRCGRIWERTMFSCAMSMNGCARPLPLR